MIIKHPGIILSLLLAADTADSPKPTSYPYEEPDPVTARTGLLSSYPNSAYGLIDPTPSSVVVGLTFVPFKRGRVLAWLVGFSSKRSAVATCLRL